jgi:NADPH-dependent 2,4-dienoyl-CoA reductase/sulfur reductase-like enzyme
MISPPKECHEKAKLTKERDLRDSRPLWIDSPRISVRSKSFIGKSHYDIVIIGAGISGALVAQALAKPGKSVLIVDKRSRFVAAASPAPQ